MVEMLIETDCLNMMKEIPREKPYPSTMVEMPRETPVENFTNITKNE